MSATDPSQRGYNSSMQLILTIVAVGVGVLIALQPALNTQLSRSLGHPFFGAFTNFAVGFAAISMFGLLIIRPTLPRLADLQAAPWWAWGGGLLGATFVTLAILLLPKLGAVLMIGSILVGQLIAASAMDQFGLFGVSQQNITPARIVGILLLVAGLVFVQIGAPRPAPAQTTQIAP